MKPVQAVKALLPLLPLLVLSSGCAVGNRFTYHDMVAGLTAKGTKTLAVATQDRRKYVVDGEKSADYTGTMRGGFGNPFDVTTGSGKPLAEDMTAVMAASLAKNGFRTVPVAVPHSDKPDAVMEKLGKSGGDSLVLLTLDEWRSDTFVNVGLLYDLTLKIFDKGGLPLAGKSLKGDDNLGGSAWNPPAHARKAVPEALGKKIEELFNAPEIANALR